MKLCYYPAGAATRLKQNDRGRNTSGSPEGQYNKLPRYLRSRKTKRCSFTFDAHLDLKSSIYIWITDLRLLQYCDRSSHQTSEPFTQWFAPLRHIGDASPAVYPGSVDWSFSASTILTVHCTIHSTDSKNHAGSVQRPEVTTFKDSRVVGCTTGCVLSYKLQIYSQIQFVHTILAAPMGFRAKWLFY